MTTTIISNNVAYGAMTNQVTAGLIKLQTQVERLSDAVTTASAGYGGTPGTEFEAPTNILAPSPSPQNLFNVQPSEVPGEQGAAYKYAVGRLHEEWAKFWAAAQPFIEQLDNGVST